ncbi:MAG TPA: DUF4142 domain-containing protein [Kofleriaceae bacterium]|nr:DUF4142 domain-containing protein [Kofleriaceae bacterium]
MRWPVVLATCAAATVAVAQPLAPQDAVVVVAEHHAIQRELALADLAQHGSERVAELGRHLGRDLGFADDQVATFAHMRGVSLDTPPDAWDRAAADRLQRLARLDGVAFDREVLAAIDGDLGRHLDWLDSLAHERRDGQLMTLLATMKPTLARYQGQAAWLQRRFRPAT